MLLELNDVLVEGAEKTVSMIVRDRQVACLTGGTQGVRSQLLLAMLGLVEVKNGFVSIGGEPLSRKNARTFRKMMAYVPSVLLADGEVTVYEPPTVQDVFNLKANRDVPISNGILAEEMKRTGASHDKAQLLAVAVLRKCPVLLVDSPEAASTDYLRHLADEGRIVVVASDDETVLRMADEVIEM